MNQYPVYIPSKNRASTCTTPGLLASFGIPYQIVVEPQLVRDYADVHGADKVLELPFRDKGLAASRNWIKERADHQASWHWQIDDDLRSFYIWVGGKAVKCSAEDALTKTEEFVTRYTNVGIAGMRSSVFKPKTPFQVNQQVYTCFMVNSAIPYMWRSDCQEDTDYSLQVLTGGWCTILINFYSFSSAPKMTPGGCTEVHYGQDGGARKLRNLQRHWPYLIPNLKRGSSGMPKASTAHLWRKFKTPLRLRDETT